MTTSADDTTKIKSQLDQAKSSTISGSRAGAYVALAVCFLLIIGITFGLKNFATKQWFIFSAILLLIAIAGSLITDFSIFPEGCDYNDYCVSKTLGTMTYLTAIGTVALILFIIYLGVSQQYFLGSAIEKAVPPVIVDFISSQLGNKGTTKPINSTDINNYLFGKVTSTSVTSLIGTIIVFIFCILAVSFSTMYGNSTADPNCPKEKACPPPTLKYWLVFANGYLPMLLAALIIFAGLEGYHYRNLPDTATPTPS